MWFALTDAGCVWLPRYPVSHRKTHSSRKRSRPGAEPYIRTMHLFLEQYHRPFGMAASQKAYQALPPVLSIPLYALQYWRNLIPALCRPSG